MKSYKPYTNIRRRALIFGLPLPFFALQMSSLIGSLLVVIFSFGVGVIMVLLFLNTALFAVLSKLTHRPGLFRKGGAFPERISNKKITPVHYEKA